MPPSPSEIAAANRRGILAASVAFALFVGSDACFKLLTQRLPIGEAIAIRGLLSTAMVCVFIGWQGRLAAALAFAVNGRVMLRAGIEGVVVAMFVSGVTLMALAQFTVILQATPLIATLLAALYLKEQVGWRRWSATLVGFGGVLMVMRPQSGSIGLPEMLALSCAILVAVRDLVTRGIGSNIPGEAVVLATAFASFPVGVVVFFASGRELLAPSGFEASLLLASAVFSNLGHVLLVRAFRTAEMSVVAPFRYLAIAYATALGYVIFGEVPPVASIAGAMVIVASGLYTLHRERVRGKAGLAQGRAKS